MADDDATARRSRKATAGGPARKAAAKKTAVKKASVTEAAAAKAAATKAAATKRAPKAAAPKKAAAKKTAATRAPAAGAAKKASAERASSRDPGAILAPRKKAPPPLRLAAEQTFDDDDWQQPEPEPVREDPSARMRAVLRAAALSLEAKEREAQRAPVAPAPAAPTPEPPAPVPGDEPVTRVLVAPVPPEPDLETEEEWALEEDPEPDEEVEDLDEDEEWSPPEVLDDTRSMAVPPAPPRPPPPIHRAPETEVFPPAAPGPPEPPAGEKSGRGAGLSIVAILLALVLPLIGAVIGFVLSGRARRRGAALSGVARVVSVLALVGWLVGAGVVGFLALRDEGIDYSKLKVGDCFNSAQSNEVRGVKVEPCSEPHNSEIFFLVTHPAGPEEPYPGKDALVQFAADACLGQPLTDYLGVPLEQSQLKDFEIVPQESAWNDGRRVLVCGLDTGGQGEITGSVKGTSR